MIHVTFPNSDSRRLTFYLATEEWLAHRCSSTEAYFFLWQTTPTVIFGRNQDMEAEVNLNYCREHSIDVVRRKSGGGCVYSDMGNLMMSCITPNTNAADVFARFINTVADVLRELGFDAVKTEHNDILIDGRKVSGNAFYALPRSSIVHGTLLYDVNFDEMTHAITPSTTKLHSHGVKSVRQRVVNLRSLAPQLSLNTVKKQLITHFCDSMRILTEGEIAEIEKIEQNYEDTIH